MSFRTETRTRTTTSLVAFDVITALGTHKEFRPETRVDTYEVLVAEPAATQNLTPEVELQAGQQFQAGQTVYTTASTNFRSEPGDRNSTILAVLRPGTAVVVLNPTPNEAGYIQVQVGDRVGYIHQSLLSATPPAAGAGGGGGQPARVQNGFVGANNTTIWSSPDVEAEIQALAAQGIDQLRIWPFYGSGSIEDMANRAALVASIAERYGITVTIDFMNGFEAGGMDSYNGATADLHARMEAIVAACADYGNIKWSVGNELQAGVPAEGEAFTQWYIDQVRFLRRVLRSNGADSTTVIGEFTPGAVGHPSEDPAAADRIRRIAAELNDISIHWYPAYPPSMLTVPANGDENLARFQRDWATLMAWHDAEGTITIGEFAIDGDPNPDPTATQGPYRSAQSLVEWLDYFRSLGWVDQVNLWQYGAATNQHIDGLSYDRYDGPYDDIRQALIAAGYLH